MRRSSLAPIIASVATGASDPSARRRLLGAIGAASKGRLRSARKRVDAALAAADGDARIHLAAASVLFVTRDYQRALDEAALAGRLDPRQRKRAVELQLAFAVALGWDQEACAVLEAAIEAEPEDPRWSAYMTRLMVRSGALEEALRWASRSLEIDDRSPRMRLEVANLMAQVGELDGARRMVAEALEVAPAGEVIYWLGAGSILAEAGWIDAARDAYERARELDPGRAEIHAELAELALWRGDLELALESAARSEEAGDSAIAARTRGAVAALRGDYRAAQRRLEEALAASPGDYIALTWRAEVAYRLGDHERVSDLLNGATMSAPGFHAAAWILRFLSVAESDPRKSSEDRLSPVGVAELRAVVCEMVPAAASVIELGTRGELVAILLGALEAMGGNRSTRTTYRSADGEIVRVLARTGVRFASRKALRQIRGRPPEQVLAALDEVVALFPGSALPVCHRGELRLWLGDLEGARRDLDEAIERWAFTRWAYIGLTGVDILEGNYERALETSAHGVEVMYGTEGPAVFVYRGEALRCLGRLSEARQDLERALAISDKRLGAWLNLGLVLLAEGDGAGAQRIWERLCREASGLLSDAATELGITIWGDPGEVATPEEQRRVLDRALVMMRGNRSTGLTTYITASGRLRFVQPSSDPGELPHVGDLGVLRRAARDLSM